MESVIQSSGSNAIDGDQKCDLTCKEFDFMLNLLINICILCR